MRYISICLASKVVQSAVIEAKGKGYYRCRCDSLLFLCENASLPWYLALHLKIDSVCPWSLVTYNISNKYCIVILELNCSYSGMYRHSLRIT